MRKHIAVPAAAIAMMLSASGAAHAEKKGYVISIWSQAMHNIDETGCPDGKSAIAPDIYKYSMKNLGKSQAEIDKAVASKDFGRIYREEAPLRGRKDGQPVYVYKYPLSVPEPPMKLDQAKEGYGFNLDGKVGANDFVSPGGERGIDNALYRAWGCDAPWRGNGNATLDMRSNDKMQEGLYTMVIRISGSGDPMNDKDATLEIGYSPDKIIKDARGAVATDFSYRIVKTAQYTKMKAKAVNGVVETEQVTELHAPRIAWFYDHAGDAEFRQGRIRLSIDADGNARGLIGGYRNWRDIYAQNTFAQDGGQQGVREHEDGVALYYALKRNADGMRDAKTGQNMGISTAYLITAAAAYVVDSRKPAEITVLAPEEKRREAYLTIANNMKKATITRIVQEVTPGTSEGGYPNMERAIGGLPIADYLLKTLDRPHFDDPPGPQASK